MLRSTAALHKHTQRSVCLSSMCQQLLHSMGNTMQNVSEQEQCQYSALGAANLQQPAAAGRVLPYLLLPFSDMSASPAAAYDRT